MARRNRTTGRPGAILLAGAAGLLTLAGLYLALLGGAAPPPHRAIGGPFRLAASDGRVLTDRSFPGRFLLIYFGYTGCRDVCPATLGTAVDALGALGPRGSAIQPLFVTVDAGHDTPAVLRAYVARFSPRLIGLTGTADQLRDVRRAYRVTSIAQGGPAAAFDHSAALYLMAPDGSFVAPIAADEDSAGMAADLARHLAAARDGS